MDKSNSNDNTNGSSSAPILGSVYAGEEGAGLYGDVPVCENCANSKSSIMTGEGGLICKLSGKAKRRTDICFDHDWKPNAQNQPEEATK